MSDDLANNWATELCFGKNRKEQMSFEHPLSEDYTNTLFNFDIRRVTDGFFKLHSVSHCGSDANMTAMMDAAGGDLSNAYVAIGSYVSGTDNPIAAYSTSQFDITDGPCLPIAVSNLPDFVKKSHVIPLPYHIPQEQPPQALDMYEDMVFKEAHRRILLARVNGFPVKSFMLELVLAGCGAVLSDRALCILSCLAKHHQFNVIVDEVFTAGRCGILLLTLAKPRSFLQVVSHVTMGKWLTIGVVLKSTTGTIVAEEPRKTVSPRGASTHLDTKTARMILDTVVTKLAFTSERCSQVIKHLKCSESECWGVGVMIFAPF